MAKKDNANDGTPIEFYVPGPGGGRSKIPIPINQPNWKYKYVSTTKPDIYEWLMISFVLVIVVASILALHTVTDRLPVLWVIIIPLGIFPIFLIYSALNRQFNHSSNSILGQEKVIRKKKKKYPKRPKNYK
ncbi:MAG: hypothetical protein RIR73_49 [Chloroflexota bacterium]